jgi:hypothetical protein
MLTVIFVGWWTAVSPSRPEYSAGAAPTSRIVIRMTAAAIICGLIFAAVTTDILAKMGPFLGSLVSF